MNRLMIRLWGMLDGENSASINYQIAKVLIERMATIEHTSTSALAELCNVLKPSISRFVKDLGYEDFYDFRAELNHYNPDRGIKFFQGKDEEVGHYAEHYLDNVMQKISLLKQEDVSRKMLQIAEDIMKYRKVYVMGNMQSGTTASNLHYNLHVIKENIEAVTSLNEQKQVLEHLKAGELAIIFSVSGEYFHAFYSENDIPVPPLNAKIWMVTTNPAIQKVTGVDELLNCRTGESLAGANIILELVANQIAINCWQDNTSK